MKLQVAALVSCASLLGPAGAAAQGVEVVDGQGAASTIVEVTPSGTAPATQVGATEAQVTTGTQPTPAASAGATIQTGDTAQGVVQSGTATTTPTPQQETVTTESGAAQVSPDSSATTDASRTAAATGVNVTVDTGAIEATPATTVKVRGGRSTAKAKRLRKRMESRAQSRAVGDGSGPGVDVGGMVTVERVRAEAFSRAGRRPRTSRKLDIRRLRIRPERGERALIDVRRATMNPDGTLDVRVALLLRSGRRVTGHLDLAQSHRGRDLLDAATYAGSDLAAAFTRLDRAALRRVRREIETVRIGGSTLNQTRGRRTTARVRVIGVQVVLAGDEASTSAGRIGFGDVTVAIGDVAATAVQAGSPIVQEIGEQALEVPGAVAAGAAAVPDAVSSVGAIFGGESFHVEREVTLRRAAKEVIVTIGCEADFSGRLTLVSSGDRRIALAEGPITCADGEDARVTLTVMVKSFFRQLIVPTGVAVVPELELDSGETFRADELTLRDG